MSFIRVDVYFEYFCQKVDSNYSKNECFLTVVDYFWINSTSDCAVCFFCFDELIF